MTATWNFFKEPVKHFRWSALYGAKIDFSYEASQQGKTEKKNACLHILAEASSLLLASLDQIFFTVPRPSSSFAL